MPSHNFTPAERELGLRVVAFNSGNTRRAATELKKTEGLPNISRSTLERLKRDYRERYETICREVMPQVHGDLAEHFERVAVRYLETGEKANDLLDGQMGGLEPRELSNTIRNMAVASGISSEKALLFRGQPTAIVGQKLSLPELASELARVSPEVAKALGVLVDEEEEVVDADVVEPAELNSADEDVRTGDLGIE